MIFKAGKGQSGRDGEGTSGHLLDGVGEHFGGVVAEEGRAEDGDAAYEGREVWGDFFQHVTQFSRRNPETRSNSLVLLVTRISPDDRACPAIIISYGPMGWPVRYNSLRIWPKW